MSLFNNLRIVIAGGSGFIGGHLAQRWAGANKVAILSRGAGSASNNAYRKSSLPDGVELVHWDGKSPGAWTHTLDGADLLVNLAGKSVNCRYNDRNRAEILRSRVDATTVLQHAVAAVARPPKLWINSSSATIYRHAEDRPQDEATGEMHNDFSVQVCKAWEAAFFEQPLTATRKVALRTAIVLGEGGVVVPYGRLARFGLGGKQGSGRQMFSWIHVEDLCRIVEWLWARPEAEGIYNAAAPGSLPNAAFMAAVRTAVGVPFGLPAPGWMLEAGAALIGTETELLLKSRWVVPGRLLEEGFKFSYEDAGAALNRLLRA